MQDSISARRPSVRVAASISIPSDAPLPATAPPALPIPLRLPGAGLLLAALALPAVGQSPLPVGEGFQSSSVLLETASPAGFAGYAVGLDPNDLYYAVDHLILQRDPQGQRQVVRALAIGATAGVVARPPGSAELFYTDFTTDTLYRRDLRTGAETSVGVVKNTFDLAQTPAGDVLLAANPLWPAPGAATGVWWLDPSGAGNHREVVRLSGPTGPLLVDPAGNLYSARLSPSFPAPPGSTSILRFDAAKVRAAIQAGPTLQEVDGVVAVKGLDGAFDLALDDRGNLYVSDAGTGDVVRFLQTLGRLDPTPVVARHGLGALHLQFFEGSAATFDPFQPDDGGVLFVSESDWASRTEIHAVRAARPALDASTGPVAGRGPISMQLKGLPAGRIAWLAFNNLPALPERPIVHLAGVPVWWALDHAIPVLSGVAVADAQGRARFDFFYPGGLQWQLSFQGAGLTAPSPEVVVSTNSYTLQLTP